MALALSVLIPLGTWIWLHMHRQSVRVMKGHHSFIGSVLFTNDSRMVVSGSEDETIRLWDVATGKSLRTLESSDGCYWLRLAPDGRLLAATGGRIGQHPHVIVLWDLATGLRFKTFTAPEAWVGAPVFSPDSAQVAVSSSGDNRVNNATHVWDIASGAEVRVYPEHSLYAYSADRRLAITLGRDKTVEVLDAESATPIHTFAVDSNLDQSLSLSPDGRVLAGVAAPRTIALWDVSTGRTVRTLTETSDLRAIQFDPEGLTLASAGDDGTIKLWETESGRLLHTFPGHEGGTNAVAFSPDHHWLASGGADGIVRVWPLKLNH